MCVTVRQASSHASRRCDVAAADRLPAAFKSENKKNIPVKKRGGRAGGGGRTREEATGGNEYRHTDGACL